MTFVFLHGRPATGKLTVARKLVTLTHFELYHNHVAVDDALQLHPFGTPGFVARRDQLWREHLLRAARQKPAGLIFTFNAENTVPQEFIDWLFQHWSASVDRFCSVELRAREASIEQRLASGSRHLFKKLTDPALYRELRAGGAFDRPRIPRTDLVIDTDRLSPSEGARAIAAHLELGKSTLPTS